MAHIAGGLFGLFLAQSAVLARRAIVLQRAGDELASALRSSAFETIMRRPRESFDTDDGAAGTLSSVLSLDIDQIRSFVAQSAPNAVRGLMIVAGGSAAAAYTSPVLFGVSAILFPLTAGVGMHFSKSMKEDQKGVQDQLAAANATATEAMNLVTTVRVASAEEEVSSRYSKNLQAFLEKAGKVRKTAAIVEGSTMLGFNLNLITVLSGGSHLISTGAMTVGELSTFLMLSTFIAVNAVNLTLIYGNAIKTLGAAERLITIFDDDVKVQASQNLLQTTHHIPITAHGIQEHPIEFDNVSFSYPSRPNLPILENLTLTLSPSSTVGITGRSGCGKSSLIRLLTGLYTHTEGTIRLGGQSIDVIDMHTLRQHTATVLQETGLFSMSIADNIVIGSPTATRRDIEVAAEAAGCANFVQRLPDGYDTQVGVNGMQLSGGERQRIALARALLRNPSILFLDEHTASLDVVNERDISTTIRQQFKGITTIIISHKLDTLQHTDRILVLDNGRIVEDGTLSTLLHNPTSYLRSMEQANSSV